MGLNHSLAMALITGLFVLFIGLILIFVIVCVCLKKRFINQFHLHDTERTEIQLLSTEAEHEDLLGRIPEEIKVSDMSINLRERIEKMLDTPTWFRRDSWRNVGEMLGMDKVDINYLQTEFSRPNGSPTSRILEWLNGKHPATTVRDLAYAIHTAGRDDVVHEICDWNWESDNN